VASRLAGYADSGDGGARRAGYAALRSTGVQRLLELAAIESPDEAAISDAEVDAKIARLIRCPDANVSLKAIEARAKHRDRQQSGDDDEPCGFDEAMLRVIQADKEIGPIVIVSMLFGRPNALPWDSHSLALFAPIARRDYPDLWARACAKQRDLEQLGAAPVRSIDAIVAELSRGVKVARPASAAPSPAPVMEASADAVG
jgi:hypothetical protein